MFLGFGQLRSASSDVIYQLSCRVLCCCVCNWEQSKLLIDDNAVSHQSVVLKSLDSHQAVVRQFSGSCQAVVRQLSGSCQAVVSHWSGSHQAVLRQSSGNVQAVNRQFSSSGQAVVRQSLGSCQKSSGSHRAVVRSCQAVINCAANRTESHFSLFSEVTYFGKLIE